MYTSECLDFNGSLYLLGIISEEEGFEKESLKYIETVSSNDIP